MSRYLDAFNRWREINSMFEEENYLSKIPDDADEFDKLMRELDGCYALFIEAFDKAEKYDKLQEASP